MLDNNTYNLMTQMVEENRSLWRIRDTYIRDAGLCGECTEFWKKMIRDKEEHIRDLEQLIKGHFATMPVEKVGAR